MVRKDTFAHRLNVAMGDHLWRQADLYKALLSLSEKYGITISTSMISQYVNAIKTPRRKRAEMMAEALGVSVFWLLGYSDNKCFDRNKPEQIKDEDDEDKYIFAIQQMTDIYKLLGYDVVEKNGSYWFIRGSCRAVANSKKEMLYKYLALTRNCRDLLRYDFCISENEIFDKLDCTVSKEEEIPASSSGLMHTAQATYTEAQTPQAY